MNSRMDVRHYSDTWYPRLTRSITFKIPDSNLKFTLITYIAEDSSKNRRLRFEIAPHVSTRVSILIANRKWTPKTERCETSP